MKTLVLSLVTLVASAAIGAVDSPAKADGFGIHFSGPGYHIDVGRPHHRHVYYGGWRADPSDGGWYGGYRTRVWHDTSHYDYRPGEFVRHSNHFHYVPGHFDYHEEGHWDDYGW